MPYTHHLKVLVLIFTSHTIWVLCDAQKKFYARQIATQRHTLCMAKHGLGVCLRHHGLQNHVLPSTKCVFESQFSRHKTFFEGRKVPKLCAREPGLLNAGCRASSRFLWSTLRCLKNFDKRVPEQVLSFGHFEKFNFALITL